MSQDWMKFEKATLEKPEVFRMAVALNIDRDTVVGKLLRVWAYFDTQTTDGTLKESDHAFLDGIVGCQGFAAAMVSVRWLVEKKGCLSLPNFSRHNGETAKTRAMSALRMKRKRVREKKPTSSENVTQTVTHEAQHDPDTGYAGCAKNVTPRLEEIRLEEIREEKKEIKPPPVFELTNEGLAQDFCFHATAHVGMRKRDNPSGITPMIAALVKTGISREVIRAEILRDDRNTNEWFSDMESRLIKEHKALSKEDFKAALKAEMKKGA